MKQRLAAGPDVGPHSNRFLQSSTHLNGVQFRPKLQQQQPQQQQQRRGDAQQPTGGYLFPHPHHHHPQSHAPTRHHHPTQTNHPTGRHPNPVHQPQQQQQQQPKGPSLPLLQHPAHLMPRRMTDSLAPPQRLGLSQLEPTPEDTARTSHAKASVMEKYESLGMVGEGSYGMVLKCRHRESGQLVAIKKFIESEDDKMVKKIAMREIRMLKQLRHENLVNLIEVFRRKKRLYLVFEFMDHTVLDDLDRCPGGLDEDRVRRISFQVLRGIEFCHLHNIIHRDIKPENILVSKSGVVKMCDFGFARSLAKPGEVYTDYVATRWYRAPELLVGDTNYGRAVDIWAIGCLFGELLTAEPLFPGESDIDQLFHIIKCFGNLTARHEEVFHRNPLFERLRLPIVSEIEPLDKKYAHLTPVAVDFMKRCLQLDANDRPTCSQLLKHDFFTMNHFVQKFGRELQMVIQREHRNNPLLGRARAAARGDRTPEREAATKAGQQTHCNSSSESERNEKPEEEKILHDVADKPKRKLPDVEKILRSSPVNALGNGTSPTRVAPSQHASWQQDRNSVVQDTESQTPTLNHSIQATGNSLERLSEKSKSQSKKLNHYTIKKPSNFANHQSNHQSRSTGAPQPFGQLPDCERFSVATKLKHGNTKGHPTEKHEGKFHLPNVRANETSSPARMAGKTNVSMMSMPQITNSDPMVSETYFKSGSTPVERRSSPEQQLHERLATGEQRATPEQHTTNFPSVLNIN